MIFPGSAAQWSGLTDITDARILAKQMLWAAGSPSARNEAFNIVNGDTFRWNWMWPRIARYFAVEAAPHDGGGLPMEKQLIDAAPVWKSIAERYGLAELDINVLASDWHTDADLGRPIEVITDMSKSRKAGFKEFQSSEDSFFDLFSTLRKVRLIP
jgi:nucleoside-diphosphate-sugar epimerase